MLWTVVTVEFYGFFRGSKLLQTKINGLTLLSFQLKCPSIYSSPFQRGITIQIFSTGSFMCPIETMTLYSKPVKNKNATTLVFKAGRFNPLTQQ